MWCILGLGNPGQRYRWSRHNVGFLVADGVCQAAGLELSHRDREVLWGQGNWCGTMVRVAKPCTYMNLSGWAALALKRRGCEVGELVVVHDDMDLPLGRLKFKGRGGDAGHKGVRSILEFLGEDRFLRLRIGIGRPPKGMDPVEFVLEPFGKDELPVVGQMVDRAIRGLQALITGGLNEAMRVCHGRWTYQEPGTS